MAWRTGDLDKASVPGFNDQVERIREGISGLSSLE
jgi:hypothetical protein